MRSKNPDIFDRCLTSKPELITFVLRPNNNFDEVAVIFTDNADLEKDKTSKDNSVL